MNLRVKAALGIFAVSAVSTLVCALALASLQARAIRGAEDERRRLVAGEAERMIEEAKLANDPLMVIDYARDLVRHKQLLSARVRVGGQWRDADPAGSRGDPDGELVESAGAAPGVEVELHFSKSQSQRRLAAAMTGLVRNAARAGAVVALLGLLLSLPLSRTLTGRIVRIEKALTDIGAGALATRLPPLGADEVGRLGAGVNAMADRLAELERLKKTFVASVTHELRSPLGAIEGYVKDLLERSSGLSSEDRAALERVQNNVRRLGHFVTNLLDMAKIERGKLDFAPRRADVAEIVNDTVRFFAPKAQEAGLTLSASIEPGIPAVRLDPDLVTHVLTNLISNAFKFTRPGGSVTVTLGRAGHSLELAVADTGIGIKTEDLGRIFAPFERVANPLRATGVGLGLAISKQIAAMHRGELGLSSEYGKGSRFHLRLPLENAQ